MPTSHVTARPSGPTKAICDACIGAGGVIGGIITPGPGPPTPGPGSIISLEPAADY